MAVNTTLAVGGVTYVFDANGLATAVPVINPATWVTDPATGVTIDTATGQSFRQRPLQRRLQQRLRRNKRKGIIREQGHKNSGKTDGRSV